MAIPSDRALGLRGVFIVLVAGVCPAQAAITSWSVNTGAVYQSGWDFDSEQQVSPPLVSTQSSVDLSPDDFSYAEAGGRSEGFQWPQSPGMQGVDLTSMSRAAGYDPGHGPPDDLLSANSDSKAKVLWWSNPGGDFNRGDDIVVEVTLATTGQLAASQFVDPNFQSQAWAGLGLKLTGGRGGTIDYQGSVVVHADPMDGAAPPMLTAEDEWQGDFQLGTPIMTDLGSLAKYEIDDVHSFLFDSRIGETFVLDFELGTTGSADGPFETYTLSDFTANYRLRSLTPGGAPVPLPFQWVPESAPDFDSNGNIDCDDVNALTAAIAAGTNDPIFDLSGDGLVNREDLDQWLAFAGGLTLSSARPFQYGDANLDGTVDGTDYVIWNANKFTSSAAWCSGDFTADGVVDGRDFIHWNANKFTTASVPEPAARIILGLVLLLAADRCRTQTNIC